MSICVHRRLQGRWDNRWLILARSNRSGSNEGPGIGNPVLLLSEPEDMEMIVFPSHDFLDHSMEAWEGDRAGDRFPK